MGGQPRSANRMILGASMSRDELFLEAERKGDTQEAARLVFEAAAAQETTARNASLRLKSRFYEMAERLGGEHPDVEKVFEEYTIARRRHVETTVLLRHPNSEILVGNAVSEKMQELAGGFDATGWPIARRAWDKGAHVRTDPTIGKIYEAVGTGVLFRGVTKDDYERILGKGCIDTDFRAAITEHEGINLTPDARTAEYYLPAGNDGVIIAIDTAGLPLNMIDPDSYIRSFQPIPAKRIIATSPVITKDEDGWCLTHGPSPFVYDDQGALIPLSKRFSLSENGSPLTPDEADILYMKAAKTRDEDSAQRLLNEAAKNAGFGIGPVWHGSPSPDFNSFGVQKTSYGFFFSHDRDTAGVYGQTRAFFLQASNIAYLDDPKTFMLVGEEALMNLDFGRDEAVLANEIATIQDSSESRMFASGVLGVETAALSAYDTWTDVLDDLKLFSSTKEFESALETVPAIKKKLDDVAPFHSRALGDAQRVYGDDDFYVNYQTRFLKAAEALGFDAVEMTDRASNSLVVFRPAQIKSCEAIVYDDNGQIVPLSKRFLSSDDIRGQVSSSETLLIGRSTGAAIEGNGSRRRTLTNP